ncbi:MULTISPECIES: hypothetical protein [Streptosporangium]|uniref:Uncharacterized protein n=1 Tax=Streptosporangium brasiliense TaxID=47480 RepID=A0ABT9RPU8_9ACTN|nr:hypothetical protein [Streptosporangium brasiliense]MDP9870385.1 hypothetical protein [Streptosporangium brasiliense]
MIHYHVIRPGESGGGKLGGRTFEKLDHARAEFLLLAPHHAQGITAEYCRQVFANGNVVRLRDGDEHGGAPIAYFAECKRDGVSC